MDSLRYGIRVRGGWGRMDSLSNAIRVRGGWACTVVPNNRVSSRGRRGRISSSSISSSRWGGEGGLLGDKLGRLFFSLSYDDYEDLGLGLWIFFEVFSKWGIAWGGVEWDIQGCVLLLDFGGLELDDGVGALLVCMYEVGGIDRWE